MGSHGRQLQGATALATHLLPPSELPRLPGSLISKSSSWNCRDQARCSSPQQCRSLIADAMAGHPNKLSKAKEALIGAAPVVKVQVFSDCPAGAWDSQKQRMPVPFVHRSIPRFQNRLRNRPHACLPAAQPCQGAPAPAVAQPARPAQRQQRRSWLAGLPAAAPGGAGADGAAAARRRHPLLCRRRSSRWGAGTGRGQEEGGLLRDPGGAQGFGPASAGRQERLRRGPASPRCRGRQSGAQSTAAPSPLREA